MVDSLTNCFLISDTKEDDVSQTLAVVPNPVQDILYLQAAPLLPDAKIGVYDLYGRLVFKGLFSDVEKGISTQTWPQGIYFLEVRHKEKTGMVLFVKILSD
ncbi:MAG: T9SS type A sorting domain-containing protein [Saprospirales bacterium]|nr:T9SS type A sorting domain-containing protein [Saprospirales bacterium]MBK8489882.1 T9SS type A sorting domain-containing protein [Saprospirales bacterium]